MITRDLIEQLQELHPEQLVAMVVDGRDPKHPKLADLQVVETTHPAVGTGTVALIKPGRKW